MVNCWADGLGNCSKKQSREHLVSKAFFGAEKPHNIMQYGLLGCDKKPTIIGLPSIVSKVLCERHNNLLEPIDSEAARASNVLREVWAIAQKARFATSETEESKNLNVNGLLLERWFLKTAINWTYIACGINKPPIELVEIVFGLKRYPSGIGLCLIQPQSEQELESEADVKCVQLIENAQVLRMMLFEFRGWKFALPLTFYPLSKALHYKTDNLSLCQPVNNFLNDCLGSNPIYHINEINMQVGDKTFIKISFNWDLPMPTKEVNTNNFKGWLIK